MATIEERSNSFFDDDLMLDHNIMADFPKLNEADLDM